MKPNGRRAWRRFAKQQRRKVNRRNRQTGTPWINDADGAFYRHEQKHFEQRPIVPVGPFTARSLVGMSQSARKRAIRALFVELVFTSQGTAIEPTDKGSRWFHLWCRGSGDAASRDPEYAALRAKYRIGERLRQCPGCFHCQPGVKGWHIDRSRSGRFNMPALALHCDGSGVLLARKQG